MKYHLQKDEKRGNTKNNAHCGASGSRAGWTAVAVTRQMWDSLDDKSKCARCQAKLSK